MAKINNPSGPRSPASSGIIDGRVDRAPKSNKSKRVGAPKPQDTMAAGTPPANAMAGGPTTLSLKAPSTSSARTHATASRADKYARALLKLYENTPHAERKPDVANALTTGIAAMGDG